LAAENPALLLEDAQLREVVEALRVEVAELRARLGQNSSNSSRPPSSDGPAKPAPKSLRRRSGRRPGGQPSHPGSTLARVSDPDEVVHHELRASAGCGEGLAGALEVGVARRQVFDLPPIRVRVTEHQIVSRRCQCCGATTTGAAPNGMDAPVQYGPRITAIILYLYVGQLLSKKRTA
jgi:transposase